MYPLLDRINLSALFVIGAMGYFIGSLSWIFAYGYRILFPLAYFDMPLTVIFFLLSVSYFLGSLGCYALAAKGNSRMAMICFISYIITGIAWGNAFFGYQILPIFFGLSSMSMVQVILLIFFGLLSMSAAQVIWLVALMSNREHLPSPKIYKAIVIFFGLSVITGVYWPVSGYFLGARGFIVWFSAMGLLYSLGAVASAILLIIFSKATPTYHVEWTETRKLTKAKYGYRVSLIAGLASVGLTFFLGSGFFFLVLSILAVASAWLIKSMDLEVIGGTSVMFFSMLNWFLTIVGAREWLLSSTILVLGLVGGALAVAKK